MARDFLALQNEVMQYGYGERERPFIKSWLNEAAWDVASRAEWRWLDGTLAVSFLANQSTFAVDTGTVMFLNRLRTSQSNPVVIEPEYVPWNSYLEGFHRSAPTATGTPTIYSFYDDQIRVYPTPNASYAYTAMYQGVPVEMSGNTDVPWMPTEHRGVLVSGAMAKMAARDKDFNAVQFWTDQYEGQISKMRMANMKVDSGRPHKVPMPRSYGWNN